MNQIRLVVEDDIYKEVILTANDKIGLFKMILSDEDDHKIDNIFTKEELKAIVKAIRFMNVDIVKDALFDV